MLKRLRTAHPILYCILAEVLFLGSLFLSSLVLTVALVAAGADFSGLDEYLLSLVQELVGAGAAWLLLLFAMAMALPDEQTDAKLGHALRRVPLLVLLTAANLFRLGGTRDKFIHTRHTGASDAAPEKTDSIP